MKRESKKREKEPNNIFKEAGFCSVGCAILKCSPCVMLLQLS